MALDPAQTKSITDALEASYQSMRRAFVGLSALVGTGQATCDEVKCYNLWTLALYNSQRGMLTTLRAAGEPNIPALPTAPTLFLWKGIAGADAWKIDCGKPVAGLGDAMGRALRGPQPDSVFLSSEQLSVYTEDPTAFDPSSAPRLSSLVPPPTDGLGLPVLVWLIIIAAVSYVVTKGIEALAAWLTENSIQVETSNRMQISADAYERYINARAACMSNCLQQGGKQSDCASQCDKLIPKPDLTVDSARAKGLSTLSIIGIIGLAAVGGVLAKRYYDHHHGGAAVPS